VKKQQYHSIKKTCVCWIGGIPAHYTREMHCQVIDALQTEIQFLYLIKDKSSSTREYEQGDFPESCTFLNSRDWLDVWKHIKTVSPEIMIVAGHYPRAIFLAIIWAVLNKKHIAYWSDTNILDVIRTSWSRRIAIITWKRFLFKWIDTFLYIGIRNRDFYETVIGRKYLQGRLFKVPFPALTNLSAPIQAVDGKVIRLLYLGRLIALKCVDKLIDAIALLPPSMQKRIELTVAGEGPERNRLTTQVKRLTVSSSVIFLGPIPSNEVRKVYAEHDVFILPSHHEAWGLVINEALAAGLPVVAPYWIGAVADLVIDGHSGFVLEDNEPETIAKSLQRMLKLEREKLLLMGQNGRTLVKDGGFHFNSATASLIEFIKQSAA